MLFNCLSQYDELPQLTEVSQTSFPTTYTIENNHPLLSLLKNGDWDNSSKLIQKLLGQLNLVPKYHPLALQSLCHNILCTFIKVFEEFDKVDKDLIKEITNLFSTDFCMYPIDYIYTSLCNLCRKICLKVQENKRINLSGICANVNKYIQEHYDDENLSVAEIAKVFSINPNYLSSLYREQEGISLHKAITQVRIKKACELLLLPSTMTIDDIAQKVGFSSVRTFYRVFKKEMSVSPGTYRNSN